MNKKKITTSLIFFLLFILIAFCLFTYRSLNSTINKYRKTVKEQTQIIQDKRVSYKKLLNRYKKSYIYSGIKLNEKEITDSFKINQPVLVVRFPELSCTTCMDSLITYLSENFHGKQLNDIYFLIDNTHRVYMRQFKRLHGITFPNIIEVEPSVEILKLDKNKSPYMFILDKNYITRSVFIPERDRPHETKAYIKIIKNKYFERNKNNGA